MAEELQCVGGVELDGVFEACELQVAAGELVFFG